MNFVESQERAKLVELIDNKKKFLQKQTNKVAAQFLQSEILFLEKNVLPIIECTTQLLNYECCRYFNQALNLAVEYKCDSFLTYIPLKPDTEFSESPRIGIFNAKDGCENPSDIFIYIYNMDINGKRIEPINLPLNTLIK